MQSTVEIVNLTEDALTRISEEIILIRDMNNQIAIVTEEQAKVSQEITNNV